MLMISNSWVKQTQTAISYVFVSVEEVQACPDLLRELPLIFNHCRWDNETTLLFLIVGGM